MATLPSDEACSYESFAIDAATVRFHFRWREHGCTYRVQVSDDRPLAPPDPALAFRVGLGLAPYVFSFLTPARLVVRAGALEEDERRQWERWYTLGLAEKCCRLGLEPGTSVECAPAGGPPLACAPLGAAPSGTLLMNGGGKDTAVAAELLRQAGAPFRWLSVNEKPSQRGLREAAGDPPGPQVRAGWEKLPPVAEFKYQGMPPVLLFYDLAAVMVARMAGAAEVAVGNERSADFGNLHYRGLEVNHQYTKSHAFERELAARVDALACGVRFYSPLRPLYELQIAGLFARLPRYHASFVSCNVGQLGSRREWCGRCPKCAFLALVLGPFLQPAAAGAIFGRDLLDDPALLPLFLELAGLQGHKPFECVGRPEEALAAVAAWPAGREPPLAVRELRARVPEERLRASVAEILESWGPPGLIPPELQPRIERAYRTLRERGATPAGAA